VSEDVKAFLRAGSNGGNLPVLVKGVEQVYRPSVKYCRYRTLTGAQFFQGLPRSSFFQPHTLAARFFKLVHGAPSRKIKKPRSLHKETARSCRGSTPIPSPGEGPLPAVRGGPRRLVPQAFSAPAQGRSSTGLRRRLSVGGLPLWGEVYPSTLPFIASIKLQILYS
jgi:hypothetical protein